MPKGRLQIKSISPAGAKDLTYQISHEHRGNEFVISVEGEHLEKFLREGLHLSEKSVQELLKKIAQNEHVLIDDVELSESEMAPAGMDYL